MRFTPDGQELILLDCFQLPESRYTVGANHLITCSSFFGTDHMAQKKNLRCSPLLIALSYDKQSIYSVHKRFLDEHFRLCMVHLIIKHLSSNLTI